MTDREYLELAAKAAGIDVVAPDEYEISAGGKGGLLISGYGACVHWNPLTDSGQALELAVKLRLCVGPTFYGDRAVCFRDDGGDVSELFGSDPYAATRRAIVRAAAEIGKGTKPFPTAKEIREEWT